MELEQVESMYSEVEVTETVAKDLGLTASEYQMIVSILGRVPTYTELGIYSVMWSEHCSYKNSILQLKTLPRDGDKLLVSAGEENAGVIDIGDGYGIAFKIESHNHPSAVEPFQGAATGVGGILRDIFTMGARPIAALNSLRFGELNTDRTRFLVKGVVKGISHYGNCFGVPTVGGEIYFDDCYSDNPLVNAMAVGIVKSDGIASAIAKGNGNSVYILGSRTGRDGIHGASLLASREFDEKTEDMRPTVQVGDPFAEKLLLEATLELIQSGSIVGIQDMGAAGISCSTAEMSAKGKSGMEINLDLVPLREADMSAYEIMLSESQERMLAVIQQGKEAIVEAICEKWDVQCTKIGVVTDQPILNFRRHGKLVAQLPAESLVLGGGAPVYKRETATPSYFAQTRAFDTSLENKKISDSGVPDTKDTLLSLLKTATVTSKKWVYEQYDSQVGTNTVFRTEGDAAVLRLKELPNKGIAVSTDCNSRFTYLDPYKGGMIAVCESARNIVCVGAEPVGITNCLNFGNPYNPEVYYQFSEAIRGIGDACRGLNTPVTGGNVSFHNESRNFAVFPTPTIGMLGIVQDLEKTIGNGFVNEHDVVVLIGPNRSEIGGSEFMKLHYGVVSGNCPTIDLQEEINLQKVVYSAIHQGLLNSAHDCSEGGLAVALAEKSINSHGNLGMLLTNNTELTIGQFFGESQSRVIASLTEDSLEKLNLLANEFNIPVTILGRVIPEKFSIVGNFTIPVDELRSVYFRSFEDKMNGNN